MSKHGSTDTIDKETGDTESSHTGTNASGERQHPTWRPPLDRRNVLKVIGGIGTASAFGLSASGSVAGSSSTDDPEREYDGDDTKASSDLAGFDKTLMYIMEGDVDPFLFTSDDPEEEEEGWEWFHKEIMGFTDGEIKQNDIEVVDFLEARFGLNFDHTDLDDNLAWSESGDVALQRYFMNPAAGYRCYLVSGETVDEDGANVRDGGYIACVTAEETTLGGDWGDSREAAGASKIVPRGTFLLWGHYNIKFDIGDPIIIHYTSGAPVVPNPDAYAFTCDLTHDDWGEGLANGVIIADSAFDPTTPPGEPCALGSGPVHSRNVITFPGINP